MCFSMISCHYIHKLATAWSFDELYRSIVAIGWIGLSPAFPLTTGYYHIHWPHPLTAVGLDHFLYYLLSLFLICSHFLCEPINSELQCIYSFLSSAILLIPMRPPISYLLKHQPNSWRCPLPNIIYVRVTLSWIYYRTHSDNGAVR